MQNSYLTEVIGPGDRASRLAKDISFQSHGNSPSIHIIPHQPDNFRGPVSFNWRKELLAEMMNMDADADGNITRWTVAQGVENDGAGGKPQFFSLVGTSAAFSGLGWEIIVMTADDFARSGRLPVVIDNEINAKRITEENFHLYESTMHGYGEALRQAHLTNITGETAIMKHSITAFCDTNSNEQLVLTWGASCIGLTRKELLITGASIKPGMVVIGFFEDGYRCNGGTALTTITLRTWGPDIRDVLQSDAARKFVGKLVVPSKSYAATVNQLIGWNLDGSVRKDGVTLAGIAHVTGGGIWGKFRELLPPGVGAILDDMPSPPNVLLEAFDLSQNLAEKDRISEWNAYSTFHGGCGMLVVCDEKDADRVIAAAREDGIAAKGVGMTLASEENEVNINSRFGERKWLSSLAPF